MNLLHFKEDYKESGGIRQSGQACDQDVLLYRFSLVHPSGPHRDGSDLFNGRCFSVKTGRRGD